MNLFGRPSYPELKRVIINLKSGTSIRGLLYRHANGYIVVREADLLQSLGKPAGAKPVSVDGEVLVRSDDVDFIQVVG